MRQTRYLTASAFLWTAVLAPSLSARTVESQGHACMELGAAWAEAAARTKAAITIVHVGAEADFGAADILQYIVDAEVAQSGAIVRLLPLLDDEELHRFWRDVFGFESDRSADVLRRRVLQTRKSNFYLGPSMLGSAPITRAHLLEISAAMAEDIDDKLPKIVDFCLSLQK